MKKYTSPWNLYLTSKSDISINVWEEIILQNNLEILKRKSIINGVYCDFEFIINGDVSDVECISNLFKKINCIKIFGAYKSGLNWHTIIWKNKQTQ